jgi:hypothetical protein
MYLLMKMSSGARAVFRFSLIVFLPGSALQLGAAP